MVISAMFNAYATHRSRHVYYTDSAKCWFSLHTHTHTHTENVAFFSTSGLVIFNVLEMFSNCTCCLPTLFFLPEMRRNLLRCSNMFKKTRPDFSLGAACTIIYINRAYSGKGNVVQDMATVIFNVPIEYYRRFKNNTQFDTGPL